MEQPSDDTHPPPHGGFKIADIRGLQDLESGSYWPQLRPHFLKPEFQTIRYSILGRTAGQATTRNPVAVRGASQAGELEVALVSDSLAAAMTIRGNGLPDYCLTSVRHGHLVYGDGGRSTYPVDQNTGLIYRGTPGTRLASTGAQERMSIWIPHTSLKQRLSALLDEPVMGEIEFSPVFRWDTPQATVLRQLVNVLTTELQSPVPAILGSDATNRSFCDLLIYTLLRSLAHNHTDQVERPASHASPRILRRAEDYMRAHVEDPISLHEVGAAAGCSVRCLQLTFRNFRDTTPLLAIRRFRLEAARDALRSGGAGVTLTGIAHRFGFSNAGRFTRLYREAFGEAPSQTKDRRGA